MKRLLLPISLVFIGVCIALICTLAGSSYVSRLNDEIRQKFDGKRWSLPAVVYARPLELFPGRALSLKMLEDELLLSGYRKEDQEHGAGSFSVRGTSLRLVSREFSFPSGNEPSQRLTITFSNTHINTIKATEDDSPIPFVRLDPARIGSFHPTVHEDRIVVTREKIPDLLITTLLTVEDQNFYSHFGVAPFGIARALYANIKAGKTVQGGSTLTQQLVKNLFLSRERSLSRKIQEAIMAILLEYNYSKDEILTAYINEVFLGQDGNRAIHGFALASEFFFRRDLRDLRPDQIAMLVGMIKGPSYYNPRSNPENCLQRRNLVLRKMGSSNLIGDELGSHATTLPLFDHSIKHGGFNRFPAFLDLVRAQLANEYREEDLKSDGLQILTTLDPQVQYQVEQQLKGTITSLEKLPNCDNIEGAVTVTSRETGEVLAITGGKNPLAHGFNRALSARRSIGSLVKPAVYLAALNQGFNLATPLNDSAIKLVDTSGTLWSPENYDKVEHGRVPFYLALAKSYNLATVQLGEEVGLEDVINTIHALGYTAPIPAYPSLFLGAVEMTPFEVNQMYHTIGSGGFYTSLRSITSVMAADNTLLTRYGLEVEQRFSPETCYLLNYALQRVVTEGTAKSLLHLSSWAQSAAGKTGTSNDLRDSWFAGFTGDHLAVVWLGRDDNKSSSLTGSSGALRVWGDIMEALRPSPLRLVEPPGISWQPVTFSLAGQPATTTPLPFVGKTEHIVPPPATHDTMRLPKEVQSIFQTIHRWFE